MKNLILFITIIFLGCTGTLNEESEFQFNEISVSYDTDTEELEIKTTIENISLIDAIDSVWAELYNCEGLVISSVELESAYTEIMSQSPYEIKYTISELPYDVYTVKFSMQDALGNLFSEFSEPKELNPIDPSTESQPSIIISYSMFEKVNGTYVEIIDSVTLDDHEWKELSFYLHVSDSNGFSDISHVKYELKGILEGCTEDTNGDGEISEQKIWLDYHDGGTPDHPWKFNFIDYYSVNGICEASFLYEGFINLRPRDGSAHDEACDEDGEFYSGCAAEDCGKVGEVYLKFIVTDSSDEPTVIDEIRLKIGAPTS